MLIDARASTPNGAPNLACTVLIVEDEELIRACLTEFLQDHGYRVIEATNVAEAKDVLVHETVDLVFSDINMPGRENGFALEKWIRLHCSGTKVLLTSGAPQAADHTGDLVEPLIVKPYRISAVIERIETALYGRRDFVVPSGFERAAEREPVDWEESAGLISSAK